MPTLAIGHLQQVKMGPAIVEYLEKIDETLAPFEGRFLIHGGTGTLIEGEWPGDLVIITFPDRSRAEAWYASPGYQAILPLRTENAQTNVILVDTVGDGYRATDVLKH